MSLGYLARRDLRTRRLRTALSITAIALGVGAMVGAQLTSLAIQRQSAQIAADVFGRTDLVVRAFAPQGFRPQMVTAIRSRPEVAAVSSRLVKRTAASFAGNRDYVLLAGIDVDQERQFHALELVPGGRFFRADEHAGVVLADGLARQRSIHVGDTVQLVTGSGLDSFSVVGILAPGGLSAMNAGQAVFVSLPTAQTLFGLGARVAEVEVKLRPGFNVAAFRRSLATVATDNYVVVDRSRLTTDPDQLLGGLQPVLLALSVISLLVGMFLVFNTLVMAASERRREIGLLRAAGATGDQIGRMFLEEGLLLGLFGSIAGVILGHLLAFVALAWAGSVSGTRAPLGLDPFNTVLSLVLGIVLCAFAAVVPARWAARLRPLEALRPGQALGQAAPGTGRLFLAVPLGVVGAWLAAGNPSPPLTVGGVVALAAAISLLLPFFLPALLRLVSLPVLGLNRLEGGLAIRSLVRRRSRTTVTVAGLALVTASLVALGGLAQSFRDESGRWVDSIFVGSYLVVSPVDQDLALREQFEALPGVASASPVSFFPARAADSALAAAAIEPLAYAAGGHLRLAAGDLRAALVGLAGDQVLLPQATATRLGVSVGSSLTLTTSVGEHAFTVGGILYHSLPAPGGDEAALFSQETARKYFAVTQFSVLQVVPSDPSRIDAAGLRRQALQYGMQVVPLADLRAGVDANIGRITLVLQALALVGVLIALMGIVNTILMNINESQREFGLLRAVGLARRQLARMVLAEAALMGAAGAILGVLIGLVMLVGLVRGTATSTFQPQFEPPWLWIALVAGAVVAACLVAGWLPARRTARRSIVESLRSE